MTRNGDGMPCYWVSTIKRLLPNEEAAHELARLYRRKNEDLRRDLRGWIRDFDSCSEVEPEEVENLLFEILSDMVRGWCCRLGEKAFAEEFLSHREYLTCRRALAMVRSFMYGDPNDNLEFPWKRSRTPPGHEAVAIAALLSLLVNRHKRMVMFKF